MGGGVKYLRGNVIQCGALCWRENGSDVEILLVTSRETGRWVIPKGWPMDGKSLADSAAGEAWEEAGIRGVIHPTPVGSYRYVKPERETELKVIVFSISVEKVSKRFPESKQRTRRWFTPEQAAARVAEPALAALIAAFV